MDTTNSPAHLASIKVSRDFSLKTPQTPHKTDIFSVITAKNKKIHYKKLLLSLTKSHLNKIAASQKLFRGVHNFRLQTRGVYNMNSHNISF